MSPVVPSAVGGGGVAVVTGSASGIGAAVASTLASMGWRVGGLDLAASPRCDTSVVVDVTDPAAVAAAVEAVSGELGPIDAAVSVAGHYAMAPIGAVTS